MRQSPFFANGGYIIIQDLLRPEVVGMLLEEAIEQKAEVVLCYSTGSPFKQERGGDPARRYLSAAGGALQYNLYAGHSFQLILNRE